MPLVSVLRRISGRIKLLNRNNGICQYIISGKLNRFRILSQSNGRTWAGCSLGGLYEQIVSHKGIQSLTVEVLVRSVAHYSVIITSRADSRRIPNFSTFDERIRFSNYFFSDFYSKSRFSSRRFKPTKVFTSERFM